MSAVTRTCVGCRTRAAREDLFRFVAIPGEPGRVAVSAAAGAGRGIWAHGAPECLQRSAGRMARIAGKPARYADLVAAVRGAAEARVLGALPALARSGRVIVGRAALAALAGTGEGALVCAGERPRWLPADVGIARLDVERDALGRAAGGRARHAIAIRAVPASPLDRALAVLRALG